MHGPVRMVAYSMGCKLAAHSQKESVSMVRAKDILVSAVADLRAGSVLQSDQLLCVFTAKGFSC